jgi:hypothetical protein
MINQQTWLINFLKKLWRDTLDLLEPSIFFFENQTS